MESILKPAHARKPDDAVFDGPGCDPQKQKARSTQAGLKGESENDTVTSRLPPQRDYVKRPSERPADVLKRLAAKSRRWVWA